MHPQCGSPFTCLSAGHVLSPVRKAYDTLYLRLQHGVKPDPGTTFHIIKIAHEGEQDVN